MPNVAKFSEHIFLLKNDIKYHLKYQLLPFFFDSARQKYDSIPVATPAFYGYSGSSLIVSQNIAKTVNKAVKLARRQKIATSYPAI